MRFRSLRQSGFAARRERGELVSMTDKLRSMMQTRMLLAGLDESGRNVGMDMRQKIDCNAHMHKSFMVEGLAARIDAKRIHLVRMNLDLLKEYRSLPLTAINNELVQSTPETLLALAALLPLHLMSPNAFKAWIEKNGPLEIRVGQQENDENNKLSIQTLHDFMDLALGRINPRDITVLNAREFCQKLAHEHDQFPLEGSTRSFGVELDDSAAEAAWLKDQKSIHDGRMTNGFKDLIVSVTPRSFRSENSGLLRNEAVKKRFDEVSGVGEPDLKSLIEALRGETTAEPEVWYSARTSFASSVESVAEVVAQPEDWAVNLHVPSASASAAECVDELIKLTKFVQSRPGYLLNEEPGVIRGNAVLRVEQFKLAQQLSFDPAETESSLPSQLTQAIRERLGREHHADTESIIEVLTTLLDHQNATPNTLMKLAHPKADGQAPVGTRELACALISAWPMSASQFASVAPRSPRGLPTLQVFGVDNNHGHEAVKKISKAETFGFLRDVAQGNVTCDRIVLVPHTNEMKRMPLKTGGTGVVKMSRAFASIPEDPLESMSDPVSSIEDAPPSVDLGWVGNAFGTLERRIGFLKDQRSWLESHQGVTYSEADLHRLTLLRFALAGINPDGQKMRTDLREASSLVNNPTHAELLVAVADRLGFHGSRLADSLPDQNILNATNPREVARIILASLPTALLTESGVRSLGLTLKSIDSQASIPSGLKPGLKDLIALVSAPDETSGNPNKLSIQFIRPKVVQALKYHHGSEIFLKKSNYLFSQFAPQATVTSSPEFVKGLRARLTALFYNFRNQAAEVDPASRAYQGRVN